MTVDANTMLSVVENLHVAIVARQFGDAGVVAFKRLLAHVHKIYTYLEPSVVSGYIVVFAAVGEVPDLAVTSSSPIKLSSVETLATYTSGPLVIRIQDDDSVSVWQSASVSPDDLSETSVVYEYRSRSEAVVARRQRCNIPRLDSAYDSAFSVPTFSDLRSALELYAAKFAGPSSCKILQNVWQDDSRIFLSKKPERHMRDSLTQFLAGVLRSAEVRPEQNVDETHPVDIKITWAFSNRLALIEIKWLGKSRGDDGSSTTYSESRALDGARQLANYLDSNRVHAPTHITRGYLVVYDARRPGASGKDVHKFKVSEIEYDPKFHEIRRDFEQPIRFFLDARGKS